MAKFFTTACKNKIFLKDENRQERMTHPADEGLLERAIGVITLPEGNFFDMELAFPYDIGQCSCLAISKNTPQMFAVRAGRDMPIPVVSNVKKFDTKSFVVEGIKDESTGVWELTDWHLGAKVPFMPHSPFFRDKTNAAQFIKSLVFWNTHAFVWEDDFMSDPYVSSWKDELISLNHPCMGFVWE